MASPGTSPSALQAHIYESFLHGKASDVILNVNGSWLASYRLHRVVLIQAGFFSSLFTAGFHESIIHGGLSGPDQINIVFDDRNITQAAFEICIAGLYGGGPPLYVPRSLIPTTLEPLTASFLLNIPPTDTPTGHQPATPRFLLSLLATAVYLSIPSTASRAISYILSSIGPYTVMDYLNFALGKPIGDAAATAAVGLEDITQETHPESKASENGSARAMKSSDSSSSVSDRRSPFSQSNTDDNPQEPQFLYGALSNKIGEASACWLARWGPDFLPLEMGQAEAVPSFLAQRLNDVPDNIPVIWRRGGLSAKWVSGLISSDMLFVRGERERYEFAKAVVELRRRDGVDGEEEKVWTEMFNQSIYYANMLIEDLLTISRDISPTTGRPYVSMSALQSAQWNHALLRHHITTKPSGFGAQGPQRDKELGTTMTTADILHLVNSLHDPADQERERQKLYYRVLGDSSWRLGDNGKVETSSMDQLFDVSSLAYNPKGPSAITSRTGSHEGNFFGLQSECQTAESCISSDPTGNFKWSPYPPIRFSVEFWGVHNIREKTPLHSHTIWYAGSCFNVYVQLIRKKGTQLGMYVHRQSSVDPVPSPSVPTSLAIHSERLRSSPRSSEITPSRVAGPHPSASTPSLRTPPSRTSSPPVPSTSPSTTAFPVLPSPRMTPAQPYRDPRSSVSVYFAISCASSTGSAMTRFSSAPDVFAVGQSWGWKSNSLMTDGYEGDADGVEDVFLLAGPEVSLRATVMLGVI